MTNDALPYADIATPSIAATGDGIFTYLIPEGLRGQLEVGQVVWVPLRRRLESAVVVRLHDAEPEFELRAVDSIVEPRYCLPDWTMEVAEWMATTTRCTFFDAAAPFLPPGETHEAETWLRLGASEPEFANLTDLQRSVVELVQARSNVSLDEARQKTGSRLTSVVRDLERAGLIQRYERTIDRVPAERTERFVRLLDVNESLAGRSVKQRIALEALARRVRLARSDAGLVLRYRELVETEGIDLPTLRALEKKGAVEIVDLPVSIFEREIEPARPPLLSKMQAEAWNVIERQLVQRSARPMLIHGVTGSGKTELYLRAAAWCLRNELGAVVLVPEIALATQIVRRFEERFPGKVAVIHSELSESDRHTTWLAIARGERPIVVGPRSALFSPLPRLGAIMIDEEQDAAYKQDTAPKYQAIRLAHKIVQLRGGSLILGSATPSIESFYAAKLGAFTLVTLPERIGFSPGGIDAPYRERDLAMPGVQIVDMRHEVKATGASLISSPLHALIGSALERDEQAIVLLNRRGMSTIVICRNCTRSVDCPHCDIPLVYHKDMQRLLCHRCGFGMRPIQRCPECDGPLDYFGAGTQRIEAEVGRLFPDARVMRVDRDSIRRLGGYDATIRRIQRGDVDIVVGTQIVAKGLDFPRVTAVGVVQADSALYLPDFRSAERTFQLLTQVAGRAGRRSSTGEVVVQTYTPRHYAIQAAARHDYAAFYEREIEFRAQQGYPPFSRLIRLAIRDKSEERCREDGERLVAEIEDVILANGFDAEVFGPAPAFVAKIRDTYQWQVIVRGAIAGFGELVTNLPLRPPWTIDVDPQSLL
ncbi:MAG: primosomal protein N' [Thermomicrobiales bacterium]|nr:primosomal protein N' [Thermomicrobiales bacterium]MCO5221273.1 primosomal protein N' [Thermomicrobiales bacterium]